MRSQRRRLFERGIFGACSGCVVISSGMDTSRYPRSAAWRNFSLLSVAMNTAASLGNHRVRRLTLRSTGPAGTCFDLRSASRRRAGYLER
jgi:hypothetical protein